MYFFTPVIVFFISVWWFFIFSNSLFETSNFSLFVHSPEFFFLSWILLIYFYNHYLQLYWVDWLSPLHLVIVLGCFFFFLFFLLGHSLLLYHFIYLPVFISVFLVGCLCFLTLEKWPFVGEAFCSSSTFHFGSPEPYAPGCLCGLCGSLLWWADHYG